jgi:hypothetical protein
MSIPHWHSENRLLYRSKESAELSSSKGYQLFFTTEPEEQGNPCRAQPCSAMHRAIPNAVMPTHGATARPSKPPRRRVHEDHWNRVFPSMLASFPSQHVESEHQRIGNP